MDASAGDFIKLGDKCNYCESLKSIDQKNYENEFGDIKDLVNKIKKDGIGKKYDCIVGVSGGVDSSYVLKIASDHNLRVLAVHMDNGWNSELAQNNIEVMISKFGFDFYSHVIDWVEYRNLMQSFFDADVIDVELLYDNAMYAVNYDLAREHNVKWVLNGINKATEGMRLPQAWTWFKFDSKNIKDIVKQNGNHRIKTFPLMSIWKALYCKYILKIKFVPILDYINFNKNEALKYLTGIGYKPYPYKHYESVFTRFYQGYILPEKFNADKRKVHLSTLVVNGQMDIAEARNMLAEIPYPSEDELIADKKYFLKKMGWSYTDLDDYIARPKVSHDEYKNHYSLWNLLIRIRNLLR
jgi:N-acetyl sugar amidotransferase